MTLEPGVRDFLTSRRARITPERAGLPAFGGRRRVPGLRREEVALLAGVSVDYYNRLERGNLAGASDAVLDSLARALQLDEPETAHLFDLARIANASPVARRVRRRPGAVRPTVLRLLDAIDAPAVIRTPVCDYIAGNALGRALYAPIFEAVPPNSARFVFLDPAARDFYPEWDRVSRDLVAALRTEAGRTPYDARLAELIGELSVRSEPFRALWASHDVRYHCSGTKTIRHPVVGELELDYEALDLPMDGGLTLSTFTAAPGSASGDALRMLASWAASVGEPDATRVERTV